MSPVSMLMPTRLVVIGSIVVDLVIRVPRLPAPGGDVLASSANRAVGGGLNVLCAAGRLGLRTALAGLVGSGPNGDLVAAALEEADVEMLLPERAGGDTGGCVSLLTPDGRPTFITTPGAESRLLPATLGRYVPEPGDAVYVSGYDLLYPVSGTTIGVWLAQHEPWLILDPGPLVDEIPQQRLEAVLSRTHVLSLSKRELAILTGSAPDGDLSGLLARMAPGALVIARAGADGAWLHSRGGATHIAAYPVSAVDTTGAGDTFTGAFLAALAGGLSVVPAARRASVAAALSTTRAGSATAPSHAELVAHE